MTVAAVALGGRIHQAIMDEHPRTEYAELLPAGTDAAVTYAGPWAEARWAAGGHPGPADMRRAFALNQSDAEDLCADGGPTASGAEAVAALMERCWPAVKTIAKQLYFDGSATHDDVCEALGLGDQGGPGSFQLARLRGGL